VKSEKAACDAVCATVYCGGRAAPKESVECITCTANCKVLEDPSLRKVCQGTCNQVYCNAALSESLADTHADNRAECTTCAHNCDGLEDGREKNVCRDVCRKVYCKGQLPNPKSSLECAICRDNCDELSASSERAVCNKVCDSAYCH
jgi:hypothetical protein